MSSLSHVLWPLQSVHLAQISSASTVSLRKLLPDHEKALSWLPKPDDAEAVSKNICFLLCFLLENVTYNSSSLLVALKGKVDQCGYGKVLAPLQRSK